MNFKKLLTIGGIGAAAYFLIKALTKGIAAKNLNVKIANLKLLPLKNASVVLSIINPSSADIEVNSIVADLSLNSKPFATLNNTKQQLIKANSSINIDLPIKINPLEGLILAADLLKNPKNYVVNVTGTVNSYNVNFPFDIEYTLK